MNYKIKIMLIAITGMSLFLVFYRFANEFAFPDVSWKLEKDEKLKMTPGQPVLQKFRASENNLKRIDILFGSSAVKPGGKILLGLFDEACQSEIRKDIISVSDLDSDKTYDMIFSKIPDSKDRIFCLSVDFEPKDAKTKKANIFLTNNESSNNISLFDSSTGQTITGKSLSFRPAYQEDSWFKNIERLNQRISQYKPFFLKHYYLYFIAFGFLVLSMLLIAMLILL